MARELREVWVVRDEAGVVMVAHTDKTIASAHMLNRDTIERLPLLTPEDAAVLKAAARLTDWFDRPTGLYGEGQRLIDALCEAERARRAARGEG
jgi:hypothetical protein